MIPIGNSSRRWRHRAYWALGAIMVVLAVAMGIAGGVIDRRVRDRLAEKGWILERGASHWSLAGGLTLRDVKLGRGQAEPVLEASRIHIRFPWFGNTGRWKVGPGPMVLRDAEGTIHMDEVAATVEMQGRQIRVRHAAARQGALTVSVAGTVDLHEQGGTGFTPDFTAVRGTLAALRIHSQGQAFRVNGTFEADARQQPLAWSAQLRGHGKHVAWQGIPLEEATATAWLSQANSVINADLTLSRGSARFEVSRETWGETPFRFTGSLGDANRRTDSFHGDYDPATAVWTLAELAGNADLWQLAGDVPALQEKLPDDWRFDPFPGLRVEEAKWSRSGRWKVKSMTWDGTGTLVARVEGKDIKLSRLAGGASSDGKSWRFHELGADVFDGRVTVSGRYSEAKLAAASVTGKRLSLPEVRSWIGEKGGGDGILSFEYRGDFDVRTNSATGRGTMKLEDAPVIHVPLLDETYQLFAALLPGVKTSSRGEFHATFVAKRTIVDVPRFEATGGSLAVSAKGQIDLKKRRVDGVARGKLGGLPGLVTQPLSRLLEMRVSGPYDNIRVQPLGPARLASNTASGTVGTAVETIEEAGKVTGTVIRESVKLPFRWLGRDADDPRD